MTTESKNINEDDVVLVLQPWVHSGEAKLYVKPEHEDQLRELLTAAGITNGRIIEFSSGPILVAVLIGVGGAGGWKALATVVTAFLKRNEHKTIKIRLRGEPVELAGYSAREVERLIGRVAQVHQEEEERSSRC
jgi:hypothetical protein